MVRKLQKRYNARGPPVFPRETLLPLMRFTKLNKPPLSINPPPRPTSKVLQKNKPAQGGLIEDLRYASPLCFNIESFFSVYQGSALRKIFCEIQSSNSAF